MKLYIIGNGFDLHHGLKTSYGDYKTYLLEHAPQLVAAFESFEYFNEDTGSEKTLWSNLEKSLSFNYDDFTADIVQDYYPNMGDDGDSKWGAIGVETDMRTEFVEKFVRDCFFEWLYIEDQREAYPKLIFEQNSIFINFNYTSSLTRLYEIKDSNILHIHGSLRLTEYEDLDFGSIDNCPQKCQNSLVKEYGFDDFYGASIEAAVNKIVEFTKLTSKNIIKNYPKLGAFIDGQGIEEIILMGHSISDSGYDNGYYENIIIPFVGENLNWVIHWYDDEDRNRILLFIDKYKIRNYTLIKW